MESATKRQLKSKIAEIINNAGNMTDEELITAYKKIDESLKEIPFEERSRFAWESGLEVLTMIFLGIEYKKINGKEDFP